MRLVGISVLALMFLVGTAASAHAECQPAVVPIGDPVLVQSVTERLTANGVATAATAGCPAVRVHLEQRGQQVHLRVADGYQRNSERDVRDVATAAALIESWTLQEIDEGSLPQLADTPIAAPVVAAVPRRASRTSIGLSSRAAVATDGAAWLGGAAGGCLRLQWTCVGALGSVLANTSTTQDATRGTHRSYEIDLIATLDVPRSVGSFVLSPGIGAGYGYQSFSQQHTDIQMRPMSVQLSLHALRASAHVSLSRSFGLVAVFVELFADASPLRTAISADPAGSPRARAGFSLGLRFEAP